MFVYRNFNQNISERKGAQVRMKLRDGVVVAHGPSTSKALHVWCGTYVVSQRIRGLSTRYLITWNAHFKVQRPRCLLLARPYGLHFSRALLSADWWIMNFKVGTPCHPTVHPDWMPGTPIDFSTVCHAKSGRLGRRMQELHKHFPWQFQIAKQINILVQWFPGSQAATWPVDFLTHPEAAYESM